MPNALQKARDLFNKLNKPININPHSFGGKVASGILKTGEAFQRANPISAARFAGEKVGRIGANVGAGAANTATFGIAKLPRPEPQNIIEKGAYRAGQVAGFLNPNTPVSLGLRGLEQVGSKLAGNVVKRVAPNATGFLAKKIVPGLGAELLQTAGIAGAKAISGEKVTPQTFVGDLGFGVGMRGLYGAGSVPKLAKGFFGGAKEVDLDLREIDAAIDTIKNKKANGRESALDAIKILSERHLSPDDRQKFLNQPLKLARAVQKELTSAKPQFYNTALGFVGESVGSSKQIAESKYASNINLDNFNVSPQAKEQLRKAVEDINSELSLNKGKPLTDKEVLNLAQVSDSLKRVVPREQTEEFAASLTKLRQNVAAGAEGAGLSKDFINDLEVLSSVAADTGRRLQKFGIGANPDARTIKQEIVAELIKMGKSADEILEKAKGYDLTNPGQATEFYRKFVKPSFGEKLSEYRYINLLSSPKTHIVNAFSNALQAGVVSPGTKLFSGAVDLIGSTLTGKQRQHYVSEVPAYYKGLFNSLGEATKESIDVFLGKKFVGRPDVGRLPTGSKVLKPLQFIPRALEANDVFFRTLIRGGEKESLLKKLARQGKELSEAKINKIADDKASYFVFRQALDSSNKSGQGKVLANIDKLTESVYSLRKVPGVSWFIPFVQTPMNILKQGIEYSPLGLTTLPGAANKTEQLSKALMGSTVMAGAAWLAQAGDSTWSAPVSEKDKEAFYASGRQPYSIKIGDQWVSYSRLGPLAYPIAMAAALKHYTQQDPKAATKSNLEKTANTLGGLAKFFSDQSYMQGLGDLVKTVQGDTSAAKQFVTNAPSQLIPLESLLGWVARTIDPIYRKPSGPIEQIQSQIPFLSKGLEPYRNPGGEPSVRQNAIFNALSPVASTPNNQGFGEMYNLNIEYKKFNAVDSKIKGFVKEGNVEGAKSLIENNREILSRGQILKTYSSKVKELQDTRDKVLADTRLNEQQKQQVLQKISQQLQQISLLIRGGVQ